LFTCDLIYILYPIGRLATVIKISYSRAILSHCFKFSFELEMSYDTHCLFVSYVGNLISVWLSRPQNSVKTVVDLLWICCTVRSKSDFLPGVQCVCLSLFSVIHTVRTLSLKTFIHFLTFRTTDALSKFILDLTDTSNRNNNNTTIT